MKKIILLSYLLISFSAFSNTSSPEGITYCVSEYIGNLEINWNHNTITAHLAGSDKYKIVKQSKNTKKSELILTARQCYSQVECIEFKIFLSPSINYLRLRNKETGLYEYNTAKLSCWNEITQ